MLRRFANRFCLLFLVLSIQLPIIGTVSVRYRINLEPSESWQMCYFATEHHWRAGMLRRITNHLISLFFAAFEQTFLFPILWNFGIRVLIDLGTKKLTNRLGMTFRVMFIRSNVQKTNTNRILNRNTVKFRSLKSGTETSVFETTSTNRCRKRTITAWYVIWGWNLCVWSRDFTVDFQGPAGRSVISQTLFSECSLLDSRQLLTWHCFTKTWHQFVL